MQAEAAARKFRDVEKLERAAVFYTLCESAKLTGVDPHTYLLTATEAALATPGAVTLPDALLATVAA